MPMSAAGFTTIQAQSAEQRPLSHSPLVPCLLRAARTEWQRMGDRAIARSVYRLGHEGVAADFRTASQRR
jgi:hypothetical protein